MTETEALLPEAIRTIEFYGDEVRAALVMINGEAWIYVLLRPLCDSMQLD